MNKLGQLILLGSLLLSLGAAPLQYRRDINGNIHVYQNNTRTKTLRKSYFGYRQYDKYNRYERTYYGQDSTNDTVNGSYWW